MRTTLSRKVLSMLLCILMCVSLFPAGAFADEPGSVDFSDAVEVTEQAEETADLSEGTVTAEESAVVSNESSAAQVTTDHYLAFATDRHASTTAISNAMSSFSSSTEYVNLIGDMVNNQDSYNVSTMVNEVKALFSGATVQMLKGNHDSGATDDVGGVVIDSTGVLYTGSDSDGNGSPDYYVYGIKYDDMDNEPSSSTVTSFKNWVDSVNKSIPIIVVCHMPMHYRRGDNAGGYTWAKALNYAATGSETGTEVTRNVVFLHGHNHTTDTNEYYYAPGASVSMQSGSSGTASLTIEFTYLTAGYLKANTHATQITITDDTIYINRSGTDLGSVARVAGGSSATYDVNFDKTSAVMLAGNTEGLSVTVTAPEGETPAVTWSSSNVNVATVDNGYVTAVAAGTATITASISYVSDGVETTKTASCEVTVHAYGEPVWTWAAAAGTQAVTTNILPASSSSNQINQTLDVNANDTVTVYARYYTSQSSGSSKTFTITSSNTSVAEVSTGSLSVPATNTKSYTASEANGDVCFTIKAKAEGTATITVSGTSNGRTYTATVTLTVGAASEGEGYTATAAFACAGCEDVQTVDAVITSVTTGSKTIYTATAEFNGTTYTDTKVVDEGTTPAVYTVTCNEAENGSVTSDADAAGVAEGAEVTLTVSPAEGYELDTLSVEDESGADVTVDSSYKFTMPAGNVTVTATFKEIPHTHAKGTYHEAVAATCTAAGSVEYWDCTGCNAKLDADGNVIENITIAALGHNYVTTTTEATCTEAGATVTACSMCGEISSSVEIPATGHNYTSEITTEATCTAEGVKTYTCVNCGDSYTEAIEALGHDYRITSTKAATCGEDGETVYTCSRCQDSYTEIIAKTDEHQYVGEVTTEATCAAEGVKTYTCSVCGDKYTETIAKTTNHQYVGEVTTEATCTTEGVMTYTCSICGASYTEAIEKIAHNYVTTTTDPTCTEAGKTVTACSVCGEISSSVEIPATGHNYTSEITTEATCTAEGVKIYTCTNCGDSYTEAIEALGHDYRITSTKAATCGEDGETIYTCSRCQDSYTETIAKTGEHQYVGEVTTEATCATEGVKIYTCSVCGDKYTETIAKTTNHQYVGEVTTEATCTTEGVMTYTCSICGASYIVAIEKIAHNYITTTTEATCTEAGATVTACSVCGEISSSVEIPATGHNYTSEVTTEATCTAEGVKTYTCVNCGDSYTETIAALGHDYQISSTKAATCGEDGETVYTCSRCQDSYTETIAKTNDHQYVGEVTTEATCTTEGVMTYTCSICGASYTEAIEKIAHNYVTTTTDPTCTEAGKTVTACSVCGEISSSVEIPATGHNYTSEVTTEATCTAEGVKTYTCVNCGDSYTETIAALGHDYQISSTKAATCGEDGETVYTCSRCQDSYTEIITKTGEHQYVGEVTTEATCAAEGVKTYTCSVCGDSYTEAIIKTNDHQYVGEVTTEATCITEGVMTYTCSICGASYTEAIEKIAHNYVTITTDPTCTEAGKTVTACSVCGEISSSVEIPATGHNYTSEVTTEATCTAEGIKTYTCTNCGESYTEAIEALGHDYRITSDKAATCGEDGEIVYTCSRCQDSYTETITKTGDHQYVGEVTTEATCATEGVKTYTCSVCGDKYTETIAKTTNHQYVGEVTTEATCTTEGVMIYTCSICGASYTEAIEKIAHNYVTITTDPTCTEAGATVTACSVCGEISSSVEIPALGHDYTSEEKDGEIVYTCTRCGDTYSEEVTIPTVTVGLQIGETYTVSAEGTIETAPDSSIATASVETLSGGYNAVTELTAGRYLIVNDTRMLTTTAATYYSSWDGAGTVNGLTLTTFNASVDNDAALFTITAVSGGYTVQSADGRYLTIEQGTKSCGISLSSTPTVLTINDLGSTFAIMSGSNYLDMYSTSFAGSYPGSCNSNETWTLYKAETAGTQLTITGVANGTTAVVFGGTRYLVTVHTHSYTSEVTTEPTCTTAGTRTYTCSCGDAYTESIAALGHNYTSETVGDTITYTCTRCGDTYSEAVPSTTYDQVTSISSGNRYLITVVYGGTTYALTHNGTTLGVTVITVSNGQVTSEVTDNMLWDYNGKFSCTSGSTIYYLYRSSSSSSSGFGGFGGPGGAGMNRTYSLRLNTSGTSATYSSSRLSFSGYYLSYNGSSLSVSRNSYSTCYMYQVNG